MPTSHSKCTSSVHVHQEGRIGLEEGGKISVLVGITLDVDSLLPTITPGIIWARLAPCLFSTRKPGCEF